MKRMLYHGSDKIIMEPRFGAGKTYNDYGQGFYCTENPDMAKEWAAGRTRDGYANCYEFDESGLTVLNLEDDAYCILHWLAVLLENRTFLTSTPLAAEAKAYITNVFRTDYQSYDVIIGYRADDSYFSFAQDFLNGSISLRQLGRAMRLGKLGEQYVLKSAAAFRRIRFAGYTVAAREEWYLKRQIRDQKARRAYFDAELNKRSKADIYIQQILDEEMEAEDVRLRQALS